MAGNNTYKGQYFVKNKEKYKGDYTKVTYRSSWEKFIMEFLDGNPNVKYWNSEETIIPYFSNADGKKRRYFIDMTIWWENGDVHLWEIKPIKETRAPIPPARLTLKAKQRFMNEIFTWTVNNDKWKTTVEICERKGWKFKIITEDTLKRLGFKGILK